MDANKIPYDKAMRRWERLNKAYATLTVEHMFENYQMYGDPDGSMTVKCLDAAVPRWIFEEDMRPMLITWCFIGGILLLLAIATW